MNSGMLGTQQHQQDTKRISQELNGTMEDNPAGQFQTNCTSEYQMYLLRRCSVPIAVLHRPEPPQPHHHKEWQWILVTKWKPSNLLAPSNQCLHSSKANLIAKSSQLPTS